MSAFSVKNVKLVDLVAHLDEYLAVGEIADGPGALNGLQVENGGLVSKVVAAVDACQVTIDAAVQTRANLLLVHHGLFWGDVTPVRGRQYRRLRQLISNDVAVYSAHLPLDLHPEVGNNVLLARELRLNDVSSFGEWRGVTVGVQGTVDCSRTDFMDRIRKTLGAAPRLLPGGPDRVSRVGVVTGGGGSMIDQARRAGIDTFVTGEGGHHTFFDAEEWGINVIYGGHYLTETFGVKALASHLEEEFGLPWEFVDHPTGL